MAMKADTMQVDENNASFHKSVLDHSGAVEAPGGSSLAAFICHDLRHPLTAILAYSELLADDNLDRLEREDFHEEIRLAVCRINDLISLLLESSKGPGALRAEAADIIDTIARAIEVVAIRPEFGRIMICYEHEGLDVGWFDPGQLQQVVTNIVLNACEAVSSAWGRIQVRSVGRRDYMEISISDNGPGIPAPIRNAVFQPFVTSGKRGGTGLGLAIVQRILRDRGGDIYLDTTSEQGTVFRVVLPYIDFHCQESMTSDVRRDFTAGRDSSHDRDLIAR